MKLKIPTKKEHICPYCFQVGEYPWAGFPQPWYMLKCKHCAHLFDGRENQAIWEEKPEELKRAKSQEKPS